MYATFERFEIRITKDQALSGSHAGRCDNDIEELLRVPAIERQLNKIPADKIEAELKEFGAWSDEELKDHAENRARILWIACGNIRDELDERSRVKKGMLEA